MKKKTVALLLTITMAAALCGCGSQPETIAPEKNQTEDLESPADEDAAEEIPAADEESADDTVEENTDDESEDLSEDSTALDFDDAEEESDESDEDDSLSFDLGFMSFELPENWDLDDYESSPEDDEYYFAPGGDAYAGDVIISVAHTSSTEEPELVDSLFGSEGADREEYLRSELGIEDYAIGLSIKDLGQTFIGKTVEVHVELSDEDAIGFMVVYFGLDNDDIYGIILAGLGNTTEDDDIQDGMAAVDMMFETGKLLK